MSDKGTWYVVGQAAIVVPALLVPVLGFRPASWPAAVVVVGCLLAAAGLGLAALASVRLGRRNLSPFPKPKPEAALVQGGIFSVIRHPIYSGIVLFVLGWGLAWSSLAGIVGAMVLLVFFDAKARREERWLETTFPGYADYRRRVKKLIPLIY